MFCILNPLWLKTRFPGSKIRLDYYKLLNESSMISESLNTITTLNKMAEAPDSVEITPIEDTEPETVANYKAPAKKTIEELETLDADDESLVSYKKQLLSVGEGACPADDPRLVIVESMSFVVDGRDDMVMDLTGIHAGRELSPFRKSCMDCKNKDNLYTV